MCGLLSKGTPLGWSEAQKHSAHIRHQGALQFINIYRDFNKHDRPDDPPLWGDEIEFLIVAFGTKQCWVNFRAEEILRMLNLMNEDGGEDDCGRRVGRWNPEYGKYMIEAVPYLPFGSSVQDLIKVEESMRDRSRSIKKKLKENERVLLMGNLPRLGHVDSFPSDLPLTNEFTRSTYFPDQAVCAHPRFK